MSHGVSLSCRLSISNGESDAQKGNVVPPVSGHRDYTRVAGINCVFRL